MGYLNRLQERILEGIIDLSKIYDRPVKSDEVASYLGIHPGSVRNAISALKVLGLIESRRGPYGGYTPTEKALIVFTKRDYLSAALMTLGGRPSRISTTITLCLTERSLTMELRNLWKRLYWRRGRRIIVKLGRYVVDGLVLESDRVGRRVVVLVKRVVRVRKPITCEKGVSVRNLLALMTRRSVECALLVRSGRVDGYASLYYLLKLISSGLDPDTPVEYVFKPIPRSERLLNFLKIGYCRF
jgi:predicted transcriptional regulator